MIPSLFEQFGPPPSNARIVGCRVEWGDLGNRTYASGLAAAEAYIQWYKDAEEAKKPVLHPTCITFEGIEAGVRVRVSATYKQLAVALRAIATWKSGAEVFSLNVSAANLETL